MKISREGIRRAFAPVLVACALGVFATACSNPFETGEIGGIEVPEDSIEEDNAATAVETGEAVQGGGEDRPNDGASPEIDDEGDGHPTMTSLNGSQRLHRGPSAGTEVVWRQPVGAASSIDTDGEVVYVLTSREKTPVTVFGLDPRDGSTLFEFDFTQPSDLHVNATFLHAVEGGVVAAARTEAGIGRTVVLDQSGRLIRETDQYVGHLPLLRDGSFVLDGDTTTAIIGTSGDVTDLVSASSSGYRFPPVATDGDTIAVVAANELFVYDTRGNQTARIDIDDAYQVVVSGSAVAGAYLEGETGSVRMWSTSDGSELGELEVGAGAVLGPTTDGFIATEADRYVAFGPDGIRWEQAPISEGAGLFQGILVKPSTGDPRLLPLANASGADIAGAVIDTPLLDESTGQVAGVVDHLGYGPSGGFEVPGGRFHPAAGAESLFTIRREAVAAHAWSDGAEQWLLETEGQPVELAVVEGTLIAVLNEGGPDRLSVVGIRTPS